MTKYTFFAHSPGAFLLPDKNPPVTQRRVRAVNIHRDLTSEAGQNFDFILAQIRFISNFIIVTEPTPMLYLQDFGCPFSGEGFIFSIETEVDDIFKDYDINDETGRLHTVLHEVKLPNSISIVTDINSIECNMFFIVGSFDNESI